MRLRQKNFVKFKSDGHPDAPQNECASAAWVLAASLVICVGCGESEPKAATTVTSPTAVTPAPAAATEPASAPTSEVANDSTTFDTLNGKVAADQPALKPSAPAAPKAATKQDAPPAPKLVAKVQPTAAQLEAWKSNKYDTLQLVKLIDSREAGFLSQIIALPDGKSYVLSGTKLTLWSIEQNDAPLHTFIDFKGAEDSSIKSIGVSSDGKLLVASDSRGTVSVFDIAEKKQLVSKQLSKSSFADVVISPDGQEIASLGFGGEVSIWKTSDLSPKKQFKVDTSGVKQLAYITHSVLAVAGQETDTWDTTSGKKVKQLSPGGYHTSLVASADDSVFSYADETGIKFIKTADSSPDGELSGQFGMDEAVRFSPDGSLIATVSGAMIRIWDRSSGVLDQVIDDSSRLLVDASWAPKSNLLMAASVDGRVHVWGTTEHANALGLKPLHDKIAAEANVPASSELILETLDLRTFPKYPKSQPLLENETSLSYTTTSSKEDVETFCRYQLQERGWQEIAEPNAMPGSMTFKKGGFTVTAVVTDMSPTEKNVSVTFLGNGDLRQAPRPSNIKPEIVYENENTVIFKSNASLPTIEAELLKAMHAKGWTAYARLNSSHNEEPDSRAMEFMNGGTTLHVMIGKYPTDPDKYNVQYSRFVSLHALPIPPDSGYVEFDGSTSPFLVANTKLNFQETADFYDKAMAKNGWLVRKLGRHIDEKICWLPYTRGADSVGIGLAHLADGRTQIRVGERLENTSWQIENRKDPKEADATVAGIEAADIPIPTGAENLKYDVDDKSISFTISTNSLAELTDTFTKALTPLGWKAEDSGVKSEEYTLATYTKNKAEVQWRATMRQGSASVSVQGDGLLWSKEPPGANSVISYETWQRRSKRPSGLDGLDAYLKEMQSAK